MLLLAGSAGLGKCANFAAPFLQQEPRSFAMAHAMTATWTYLTRRAPQLSERRGFQAKKGVHRYGDDLPWWRSHCERGLQKYRLSYTCELQRRRLAAWASSLLSLGEMMVWRIAQR